MHCDTLCLVQFPDVQNKTSCMLSNDESGRSQSDQKEEVVTPENATSSKMSNNEPRVQPSTHPLMYQVPA